MLCALVLSGLLGAYWFAHNGVVAAATELPYDQFNRILENGQIYRDDKHPLNILIEEGSSIQTVTGFYSDLPPARDHLDRLRPFHTTISLDYDRDLKAQLKAKELVPNEIRTKFNLGAATLLSFVPLVMFLLVFAVMIWTVIWLISLLRRPPAAPAPR